MEENSNFGGAIWSLYNLIGKRGIRISFKPSIIVDTAYFGNVKYPQGFAIVLTSSSTSNLIGNKISGIGYDGINNGIAFEFDFIRQSDKEDNKKPHLSVHYNITGEISSKTPKDCDAKLCNLVLPNFYDSSVDDYRKNMIFEIEIIGKKLSIRTNTGKSLIEGYDFEAFSQLLEQDEVFIGITASMNQNKKITINDFSLSEISVMEKGQFYGGSSNYTAGETISLYFSIKSTCGQLLKIYPKEYSTNNGNNSLSLIINNNVEDPAKIVYNFNDSTTNLRFDISRTKTGTYTALVKFNDNYSSPVKFTVLPGKIQRFEICNEKENIINENYINSNLEQTKDSFRVPICSYDQYNNSRTIDALDIKNLFKILYPHYVHSNDDITYEMSSEKINYKIPFSTFGIYQIFNESFKQNPLRLYNLSINRISPENSDVTILYGKHLITNSGSDSDSTVTLRLKLKDEFGRDVPNSIIKEMGCNFDSSYIENNNKNIFEEINSSVMNIKFEKNDIIYLILDSKDLADGKYTFIPKIKCINDLYDLTLKCSETEDDENSIYDKCSFYKNTKSSGLNSDKIRIFSDFSNEYIYLNNGNNNDKVLFVSLDEYNNKKITEINLLDKSDYPIIDPSSYSITCKLDNNDLKISKIGYSIAVMLITNLRNDYDNTQLHTLKIDIDSSSYNVNLRFISIDKTLNNMYGNTFDGFFAFYQQESYTIQASKNILLFEVFKKSSNSYLVKDSVIKDTNLIFTINGKEYTPNNPGDEVTFIEKDYSILISTNLFMLSKTYSISLKNSNTIIVNNIQINVIPSEEVSKLVNDQNIDALENIDMTGDYIYLFLSDKYGNKIRDNQAILSFSKFEIISNGLKAHINLDGKLFISKDNNSSSNENNIKIILPSGLAYNIIQKKEQSIQSISPHKTYGLLNMNTSNIVDSTVSVNLYLYDENGNNIISENLNDSEIENFDVYIIDKFGKNKKFITFDNKKKSSDTNILNFNTKIFSAGEYEIKIFYKNIYVSCKACNFIVSSNKIIETENTRLYILGNKRKIPVFTNDTDEHQFLLTNKNFIFYLQFYDKFFNEITVNTQYSLSLNSKDNSNLKVKLCNYGNSKSEGKQFYRVCSDQLNNFNSLKDGLYFIEVNRKIFSFYVSNEEKDSNDVTPVRAIYHQYENDIYGTTDSIVSLIIDLRNSKNMRVDLNKIFDKININLYTNNNEVVDLNDYNFHKNLGPENGLFTIFLNIKKIGKYSLKIKYDDKEELISRNLNIIISCGTINNLKKTTGGSKYYKGVGTYTFYNVLDINDETCNKLSNNSWNVFNDENYIQNLIKAKNINDDIYYSTTKYYNHMNGILSIIINSQINDDIELSSEIFKFSDKINQNELSKEKINKEYIYAEFDDANNQINIMALKKNYQPYDDFSLDNNELLTLSILKYINDETVLIKEYNFNNNIHGFKFSDDDIYSPGDYLFVIYLNGEVISCGNCYKKVEYSKEKILIKNTKIYLKNGYNKYSEGNENIKNYIYKTSFPFFKINFQTKYNDLIKITEDEANSYDIKLYYSDNINLETKIIVNNYNGNVYLYLTEKGRKDYLSIPENIRSIFLSIKNEKTIEYILFNDYVLNNINYEKCNIGAQPIIADIQTSYILRADEQKEIEVYLEGCTEQVNNADTNNFKLIINNNEIVNIDSVIPLDTYGDFILLINYKKTIIDPTTAYIKYLNGKTESFQLSILPGYDINSVQLIHDDELEESNTNYKYAYILMELKDTENNLISNIGRNLFINDINILNIIDSKNYKLPYKLSFDDLKKKFRVEIPISGNGNITINSQKSGQSLSLEIKADKIYHNINFKMEPLNNKNFKFTMKFLDDFYKKMNFPNNFNKDSLSFIYITENFGAQEYYSIKLSSNDFNFEKEEINIELPKNVPIYQIYSFIPIVGGFTQICYNCQQKYDFNNYIYSVHNNLFYPHLLDREIHLQKNYEYPLYIYFSNIKLDVSSSFSNFVEEFNINDNNYYYIFGLKNDNSNSRIEVEFKTFSKKLIINLNDGKTDTYTKEMDINLEKYYFNYISFISGNNGKLLDLFFYIDVKNSNYNPVYISSEYTSNLLSGKIENKTLIEYLNLFQTEINGTFLVIIPNNKLINGNYNIGFSNQNTMIDNDFNNIVFNSFGSFPNKILLINKEMIYKNMIKYDLIGQNENSELICDQRLNIYIEPKSTKKFLKGEIVNDNKNDLTINSCKLYIKFIGDINIITNIGEGFLSELTNSDNSIYNINPHYSKFSISPNIIDTENYNNIILNVLFNEHSSEDLSFLTDEMPANKGLKSIKYISSEYTSNLLSGKIENKTLIEYLNLFQTEINGTFLVIIPNNKLINGNYNIGFSNQNTMIDNDFNNIVFNSFGSFPNKILLINKEMIYKNMIKYDLIGQNENSELICDQRLNIYIEPKSTKKFLKGEIVNDNKNDLTINSCKLYIKFIGDINIITNIGEGFLSELTNSDNSIYNINPHYSKFSISPNIIDTENYNNIILNVLFNEHSSEDLSFLTDEMPANKGLKSIKYITSTKYEFTQDINGLFSSQYTFLPSQFKINTLGTYLFISSISNNNFEKPVFVSYIKKQNQEPNHFTIKYFENNKWKSIDNILDKSYVVIGEPLSFKYPFHLKLNILDKYNSLVRIENKLSVSIISPDKNDIKYSFDFKVKQINDFDFIIEPYINDIEKLIHMETKNSNNKFYIKFVYDNITYYALLNSKNENNLHPRVSSKEYDSPGKELSSIYSLVNEYETENENNYYIIPDEPNSEVYCFVQDKVIFNDNIDISKISFDNSQNIEFTNSYRGCIKIGIKTSTSSSYKITIKYDGNEISSIMINPLSSSKINFPL